MGLGKTAIVVAEIWIMILLIEDSKKAIDVENFRHSRYFDARTLMDNRGHLQPAHRNGSYSGSCYASVAQRMGYQHPQVRWQNQHSDCACRTTAYPCREGLLLHVNRCLKMLDEIAPGSKWYPSQAQLEMRYTKKGLRIPKPFLVTHLLERNLIVDPNWSRKKDDKTPEEAHAREATREEMLKYVIFHVYRRSFQETSRALGQSYFVRFEENEEFCQNQVHILRHS